jgi:hypothetical protein
MMEAVRTPETSVNFNVTTRRYIPEDSELQLLWCLPLCPRVAGSNPVETVAFLSAIKSEAQISSDGN